MLTLLKRVLLILVLVLAGGGLWLTIAEDKIDSAAWTPPEAPKLEGVYEPNTALLESDLLAMGELVGPEDVAVDSKGIVYGGTADGKIVRVHKDGRVETWVTTGGRPLGLHFDAQENLIVADSYKGLLSIDPQGEITVLTTEAEGFPFAFTDDLDVAKDGKIYFTDASSKWTQPDFKYDLLETRPFGRFLVYDPADKSTTVLARDLYFPNGVAVSADQRFVLFNETWRYRIRQYWLEGPKKGQLETFVENLPGFPDGVSTGADGLFWVALATVRNADLDAMHPYPWLKNLSAKLPEFMQPQPSGVGFVLALDEDAGIVLTLQDPSGLHLHEITSVQQHGKYLYFGSLSNDRIGRLELSEIQP